MVEVVILDKDSQEVLRRDERDFIKAEFVKRVRANTGLIVCVQLELPVEDPLVLEPLSDEVGLTVKLVDKDTQMESGITDGELDEYKIKPSNSGNLAETLSVAGTKI